MWMRSGPVKPLQSKETHTPKPRLAPSGLVQRRPKHRASCGFVCVGFTGPDTNHTPNQPLTRHTSPTQGTVMELPDNPTQLELRAWSNARQALGPERCKTLDESTNLTTRLGRVVSSSTSGLRKVETRSVNVRPVATRRGGSPTRGRKATPTHNPMTAVGNLSGEGPLDSATTPLTPAKSRTAKGLFDMFLSVGDPRTTLGLGVATVLFVLAVL